MYPSSYTPAFGQNGTAGLPGRAAFSDPRFMFTASGRNVPITSMLEVTSMMARPETDASKVGAGGQVRGIAAIDVLLSPTPTVVYPDGNPAVPVALLLGPGTLLGAFDGRSPIQSNLSLADIMLPYFLADRRNPNGYGQETFIDALVSSLLPGCFETPKHLPSWLMEMTQLVDEVDEDARQGQPPHHLYGDHHRPRPILTYQPALRLEGEPLPPADPQAPEPGPLDHDFAALIRARLDMGRMFYINDAAADARVSPAMAGFLLRRMEARGEVTCAQTTRTLR